MRISRAGGQFIKPGFTSADLLLPRAGCACSLLPSSLRWGWACPALWTHTKCALQCFWSSLSATKICSCSRDDGVGLGQGLAGSETVVLIYRTFVTQTRRQRKKVEEKEHGKKPVLSPSFFNLPFFFCPWCSELAKVTDGNLWIRLYWNYTDWGFWIATISKRSLRGPLQQNLVSVAKTR